MAQPGGNALPQIQIPHLVTDPIWALQPWAVTVDLGALELEIPALPAAAWLAVLMRPDWTLDDILPGLLSAKDDDVFADAILDGILDLEAFEAICLDVLATVSARPWYVALRLISVATRSWDAIGGELAMRGVDAGRLSLAAWLDATHLIMQRNMKPESLTMFHLQLELPPQGEQAKLEDTSRDQFLGMMGD